MNLYSIIIGILAGGLISFLGVFVINRRLALAADAFSHIALPGVAVAILLNINPTVGALFALLFGTFIIQGIQSKTKLFTEVLIGLTFSLSLAIGLLLLPEGELESALLGDIASVGFNDFILGIAISVILFGILIQYFKKFTFLTFSETLAQVSGVNVNRVNFVLLVGLALSVALGIKVVGTLLVGSLLIIPAAASQIISKNFKSLLFFSSIFGLFSVAIGMYFGFLFNLHPGPMIILVEGTIFGIAFLIKQIKG
ncbi:MAG: metal ABC transporter permease [Patescibacteria group bacterium]